MNRLRQLVADIMTPSTGDESLYAWSTNQLGHAMLGALLVQVMPALLAIALFCLLKEAGDLLLRRGSIPDSLADVAFVALGTAYGTPLWVALVWALIAVGIGIKLAISCFTRRGGHP